MSIHTTLNFLLSMHATPIADVEIGFVSNETEVSEGEQAVLVVRVLAGQFPEGVVVNVFFQTIPGSATGRYSNNHLGIAAVPLLRELGFEGNRSIDCIDYATGIGNAHSIYWQSVFRLCARIYSHS